MVRMAFSEDEFVMIVNALTSMRSILAFGAAHRRDVRVIDRLIARLERSLARSKVPDPEER